MNDFALVDRAVEMTFTVDRKTSERLRKLVSSLDLPFDNVAVRLAFVRSLADGPVDTSLLGDDFTGKELKGRTLFGGADTAPILLGQLLLVEGRDRVEVDLRNLVLGHWSRGQAILDAELEAAGRNPDIALKRAIDRISGSSSIRPQFASRVVGQPQLAEEAIAILQRAKMKESEGRPPALGEPVVIVGRSGSGRSFIAEEFCDSLGGEVHSVEGRSLRNVSDLSSMVNEDVDRNIGIVLKIERIELAAPIVVRELAAVGSKGRLMTRRNISLHDGVSVVATSGVGVQLPGWTYLRIAPYERDAIAQIIRTEFGWHIEVRRSLALAGRLCPARALERSRELAQDEGTIRVSESQVTRAMKKWKLDRLGLSFADQEVMKALVGGPPAKSKPMAELLQLSPEDVTEEVLPYLSELGLVEEKTRDLWIPTPKGANIYG
jgi:Holliday junction resolvasome RuvABC ATP-dependent DNA helicase subunit